MIKKSTNAKKQESMKKEGKIRDKTQCYIEQPENS